MSYSIVEISGLRLYRTNVWDLYEREIDVLEGRVASKN